jgi:hypothetical protein
MVTPLKPGSLIPPKAPNQPIAPNEYNRQYQDQYANALRLYFNQIDNFCQPLSTNTGGAYIQFPYGAFASYVTQTTTVNTATQLTFSQTDFSNGVTLNGSNIVVANAGIYNLQFSVQVSSLDNAPVDVSIWLRQNGVDIAGSTGLIGMLARKGPSNPSHDIKGWNYFLSMNTNDNVQIWWSTPSANVSIVFYAAGAAPVRPSTASVVATMSFVSSKLA